MDKIKILSTILDSNIKKTNFIKQSDKEYFSRIAKKHSPFIFWIGCSDSRVNTSNILDIPVEEIFTYRNIGNIINETDLSINTAIEYAINVLNIKNIVICGHSDCGAIKNIAQFWIKNQKKNLSLWFNNIVKDLIKYDIIINNINNLNKIFILTKLNVLEQTIKLTKNTLIQKSFKSKNKLCIYSLIYYINQGIISHEFSLNSNNCIKDYYNKTIREIKLKI